MRVLICSDIFGHTDALYALIQALDIQCDEIVMLDPYEGVKQTFENEQQAYASFLNSGGIDAYIGKIHTLISQCDDELKIVGFSAGGAAAWKALAMETNPHGRELMTFYPGQIRHYLDVIPKYKTRLIFPAKEPHFDVQQVHSVLSKYPLVSSHFTQYYHGFMNAESAGFNKVAYDEYLAKLQEWLSL